MSIIPNGPNGNSGKVTVPELLQRKSLAADSTNNKKIINQIADTKNKAFLELIAKEGVSVFKGTLLLIKELRKNKIK